MPPPCRTTSVLSTDQYLVTRQHKVRTHDPPHQFQVAPRLPDQPRECHPPTARRLRGERRVHGPRTMVRRGGAGAESAGSLLDRADKTPRTIGPWARSGKPLLRQRWAIRCWFRPVARIRDGSRIDSRGAFPDRLLVQRSMDEGGVTVWRGATLGPHDPPRSAEIDYVVGDPRRLGLAKPSR